MLAPDYGRLGGRTTKKTGGNRKRTGFRFSRAATSPRFRRDRRAAFGAAVAAGAKLVAEGGAVAGAVCGVVQVRYNDGMTRRYTIILEREADGGYHAFCPALPGCHTQGETEEEAMANAAEAVDLYLESRRIHRVSIGSTSV